MHEIESKQALSRIPSLITAVLEFNLTVDMLHDHLAPFHFVSLALCCDFYTTCWISFSITFTGSRDLLAFVCKTVRVRSSRKLAFLLITIYFIKQFTWVDEIFIKYRRRCICCDCELILNSIHINNIQIQINQQTLKIGSFDCREKYLKLATSGSICHLPNATSQITRIM